MLLLKAAFAQKGVKNNNRDQEFPLERCFCTLLSQSHQGRRLSRAFPTTSSHRHISTVILQTRASSSNHFCSGWMHLRHKATPAIFKGSLLKRGQKERSKGHLYTRAEQRLPGSVLALASLFGSNNLCASSGGFTLKFSALYYRVCPPGALETCGCSAIKDTLGLKRSPYHTSLMGCTSFQVTHEQYQNISSAIPFFTSFLRFFPLLFRADIPTRKEEEEVTKTPILHFIIYSFQSTPIKPFSGCYSLSIK